MHRGEHPRALVHRIELLDDKTLDDFRSRHPDASAMDESLEDELGDRSATPG